MPCDADSGVDILVVCEENVPPQNAQTIQV